jgi:hypothetical protein
MLCRNLQILDFRNEAHVLVSVILLGECDRFDVMKPIAGSHCRRKITPTIHIMIRVPVSSC